MAKAQPKPTTDAPDAGAPAGDQGASTELQALATAGAPPGAGNPPAEAPPAKVERRAVRVLAAVTIADVRYQPGVLIEGIPVDLAEAHAGSVDAHPDAVAYARSTNAQVLQFEPERDLE
ncbi:hypothetical protein [Comamonas squillarum]|uniref:Uncharacterized protein n=1 Tax=Comamonas squillarum TaxID=2977320 RepID=A0ABY6A0W7_9BURK|nr:hypothetical protein [Comamonas sp. PR12]UXC18555.1 hypothetical protein N4T19_23215 [Comamonas sp. PR12]